MKTLVVLLGGDAMTGRGVDQILPFPSDPHLEESFVKDARAYLKLAVRANGPLSTPVDFRYLWGDALAEMDRARPAARIVNLETSVTRSDGFWPGKGIHYRMSPENAPCLSAAGFDVCCLANNHTLDFGRPGLLETIGVLRGLGLRAAGAGRDADDAWEPALLTLDHGAIQVFALGTEDSGIPPAWAAATNRPGINLIPDLSSDTADRVAARIARGARDDAVVVVSIHWGGNWGYRVPPEHVRFARSLVEAGVDIVHGHSSHHPRPIEIYRDRLILYGCGEFIDDYEGIAGYEHFRDDLVLMYFATVEASGALVALSMIPMQIKNLRLTRPSAPDTRWLAARLDRICRPFSTRVAIEQERLVLRA